MSSPKRRPRATGAARLLGPFICAALALAGALIGLDRAARAQDERLSVVYCIDCVPFHFQDESGDPTGLIIDYWRLWSDKTGIAIDFIAAPWDDTLKMVGSGAVDAHAGLFYSEARDQFLDYGSALRPTDTHVFFHRSVPTTTDFRELAAYRIGVIGNDFVEGFLDERVPGDGIVGYPDYDTLFDALEIGELKVFAADTPTALYHLKRTGLMADFAFVANGPLYRNEWFTAAQDGDAATIETINRGMASISEDERREIARRWIGDTDQAADDDALIIAVDRAYAPFTFMNAQGRPAGLFVDLWQAWADKTGREIRFRASNWTETLDGLRAGEVDIHSGLSYSDARAEWVGFSQQIYQTASRLYHRAGDEIPADIGAFGNHVLGVWSGTFQAAEVQRLYPATELRLLPTSAAMVDALQGGVVDAILQEDLVMDQSLRDMGLQGEIVARPERLFVSTIHGGVAKDQTALLAEIEDGLDLLSGGELSALEARWVADPETRFFGRGMADFDIGLTRAERAWLNNHPFIRLGADRAWKPYEYLDDQGVHRGLSAGVVDRIEQILGISLQPPPALAWSDTIERLRTGGLDAVAAVAPTPDREDYLIFTEPYMSWLNVIATRTDAAPVGGVEDLDGKRVGVASDYAIQDILADLHPDIELVPQPDIADGLRALSAGQIDAFVDSPVTIGFFLDQLRLTDLAVVAETPYKLEVALAVRSDWPEFAAILDKALAQIPQTERLALAEAAGLPTEVSIDRIADQPSDLLSADEAWLLAGVIGGVIGLIFVLTLVVRGQRRPFLQSLRGKSMVFIGGVFVLVGGATIWAFLFVSDHISAQLGLYVAERHVLWHKERVLGAVQRELALAEQMARSEILIRWSQDEANPTFAADARRELQAYHDNFSTSTYFVGLIDTGHFFYADGQTDEITLNVIDTLSRDDIDDAWFFATIADSAPYNLNVDHNSELGVTNLWVNYALRRGEDTYGVVGTGVQLTDFINSFLALETKGVTAMMIDNGGAIQAHVDETKIAQNVMTQESADIGGIWDLLSSEADRDELRRHMANLQSGTSNAETFFLDFDGAENLMALSYLEPLGWYTLAAFEPGSVVGVSEMGPLTAVLAIALLITLMVFVVGQNLLIIRPLNKLREGAQSLSGGNYDISLEVHQRDEIGDLTRTFSDMAAIIADHTGTLEAKVEERTRELQESEQRSQAILNTAFQLQGLLTRDGTLIEANAAALAMINASKQDVAGLPFWDCPWWAHNPDLQARLREAVNQAVAGETVQFLATHPAPDGDLRQVDFRITPVRDEHGEVVLLVPEGHDITELKQAEAEIRHAYSIISESVDYASAIQRSLLPPESLRDAALGDHFIWWQPRDVVGGDIYWLQRVDGGHLLVVADCTGHGVPGAFMTLIASGALEHALNQVPDGAPAAVLSLMNRYVKTILRQDADDGHADDGLELGLLRIADGGGRLRYAGARFSLWRVAGGKAEEWKGDKTGIGYRRTAIDFPFTEQAIEVAPGGAFYLCSDGLIDQIGGPKQRSFGKRRFLHQMIAHAEQPMPDQRAALIAAFEAYQGDQPRRDDITVVGFRLA